MNDVDPQEKIVRARWLAGAALGWTLLSPVVAQAQSYSPGDLVITPPPSLSDGRSGNSIFNAVTPSGSRTAPGAPAANPPEFQYSAVADLSGRYTTNVLGSVGDSPDFDARALLNLTASETTRRLNASLNYTGAVDYFAEHSSGTIFTNNLTANALADIMPDHLTLSASLFASPQYATQLGNIAPSGETLPSGANNDLRNTYGFSVSPDFTFRLGDFVRSDSVPSYSEVFYDQPTGASANLLGKVASNIGTGAFTQRFTSGDYFSRLQWSAVANYTQMSHSAGGLTQRSATGELSYALTHGINLVADGGYQTVKADVPLSKALSGPVIMAGLQFDTPRITGEFRVGEQYRALSVTGRMTYQLSPVFTLTGAASDNVSVPGAGLFDPGSLGGLGGGASIGIQLPVIGGMGVNSGSLFGLGLQSSPARIQSESVALQYSLDRLTAVITGTATTQSLVTGVAAGQNNSLRAIGVAPSFNYVFSEDLSAGASFSYSDQTLAVGRSSVAEFNVHGNYTISDLTQVYIEGDYLERNSNSALAALSSNSGDVSITSVRVGIRRQL